MEEVISENHLSLHNILDILKCISYSPSAIDMNFEWEAIALEKGHTIKCSFKRPDTNTGEIGTGWGREWYLPKESSEKFIVMTAWMAIEQVVKHELMEMFLYNGARMFDPHKSLEELAFPNEFAKGSEKNNKVRPI